MGDWLKQIAKKVSEQGGVFLFLRAQLSAQVATIADFLLTILLVKFSDIYYVYATLTGGIFGGVVNCVINYEWTFKSKECKKTHVAAKFILVWIGSIWLNTWGTYACTELMGQTLWVKETLSVYFDNYFIIPKIVVAILVALFWNYNMQRIFVYRNVNIKGFFKRIK